MLVSTNRRTPVWLAAPIRLRLPIVSILAVSSFAVPGVAGRRGDHRFRTVHRRSRDGVSIMLVPSTTSTRPSLVISRRLLSEPAPATGIPPMTASTKRTHTSARRLPGSPALSSAGRSLRARMGPATSPTPPTTSNGRHRLQRLGERLLLATATRRDADAPAQQSYDTQAALVDENPDAGVDHGEADGVL
jgi:hypothetical protein